MAVEGQFMLSPHGFGNFEIRGPDYAGGSCVACHTSQGFTAQFTGEDPDWSAGVASMNCRTCHQIHTDFDGSDYALTTTDAVELRVTGQTVDFGEGVNSGSNLCASCHQGRERGLPYPDYSAPVTQMFQITSTHYGFHYGSQANVFSTYLPESVEFGVETTGPFTPHDEVSCTGCHMGVGEEVESRGLDPQPVPGGELGHNWAPSEDVCAVCHDADFNYGGVREDVMAMVHELEACLEAEGVMHDGHPVVGSYPEPYVAAFLVWDALSNDGSWGVHQPRYAFNLAEAALTQMSAQSSLCAGAALP